MRRRLHMLGLLITLALLAPSASFAARGFGTTDGVATTDKLTSTHTTTTTSMSFAVWVWRTGAGGANFGRIFSRDETVAGFRTLYHDSAAATYVFAADWTTTDGNWTIAEPSAAAWHHICVVYDGTTAGGVPIIYVDGVSVTVTTVTASAGTLPTGTGAYVVGNRADNIRHWNGRIAEFAMWENTILTSGNATSLAAGTRADGIGTAPTTYWKLCGTVSPEPNEISGGSTVAVTGAPVQAHPFANCEAPPPPAPGDGQQFNGTCNTISWTANIEADLAGYRLYDRVSLTATPTLIKTYGVQITSATCVSLGFNAGQHYLSLRAFDTSGNESQGTVDHPFVIVIANQVSDLRVTIINATDMTLSFKEVDGGNGAPAKYEIRFATPSIDWGFAPSVTSGTCATPLNGTTIGAQKTCTVTGLSVTTPYQFQLVPFRGTLGSDAIFGPLSNVASGTTGGTPPVNPTGRTTLVIDTFDRADNSDLGSTWVVINGPWSIASNLVQPQVVGPIRVTETNTTPLPPRQWAQITINAISGTTDIWEGVTLMASLTQETSYQFFAAKGAPAGSMISRRVNGSISIVALENTTVWVPTDILRAERDLDGTLRLYRNDTLVLTGTDTTLTSGYAGIWGYLTAGAASTMRLDTFSAGGFTDPSTENCGCDSY